MDFLLLVTVAGYSIIPAAVIGFFKLRTVAIGNQAFIVLCMIASINELLSFVVVDIQKQSNAINSNIYIVIEIIGYLVVFYLWNTLKKNKLTFSILSSGVILIWIVDNFILHKIIEFTPLCRVVNWTVISFLSIEKIGNLKFQVRGSLIKDSTFIICSALIIFGVYKAIFEFFVLIKLNISNNLFFHLYEVLQYVNIFSNTLFALAILWMPKKHNFTMPFS